MSFQMTYFIIQRLRLSILYLSKSKACRNCNCKTENQFSHIFFFKCSFYVCIIIENSISQIFCTEILYLYPVKCSGGRGGGYNQLECSYILTEGNNEGCKCYYYALCFIIVDNLMIRYKGTNRQLSQPVPLRIFPFQSYFVGVFSLKKMGKFDEQSTHFESNTRL